MRFQFSRISEAKDYILTALLLLFAITLLIGRNQGGIDNLRKISVTIFSYVEEPLSNIRLYRQALRTNTDLRKQNVQLLDELNRLRSVRQRNDELMALLELGRSSDFNLYPAQIVGKELNQVNNVLTIDAGSNNGIQEGMPFISANGLVGKVVLTSPRFAQVMPHFNTLFRVSAKLQNTNAYGIVSWDGPNAQELKLNYIPQTIAVETGETVVTSGYSNQYPPNIAIGEVIRSEPNEGRNTQNIFLRPATNLFTVAEGFVITTPPDTAVNKINEAYRGMFE